MNQISICIPFYKNVIYLERLLESIATQIFRDFEVIISDDGNDLSIQDIITVYERKFSISYYKNNIVLGSPDNWNFAISKASGKWIKLMHNDDWFASKDALQIFYENIEQHPTYDFFFSAYSNVEEFTNHNQTVRLSALSMRLLKKSPLYLFKKNFVGNPSCTLIRSDIGVVYDNQFKWVVDFEYYIRCLQRIKFFYYIDKPLINVGIHGGQITKNTFRRPEVEIPENHLMVEKMGSQILKNIYVYDYFWRLYRNLGIRNEMDIEKYYLKPLDPVFKKIISFQKEIPLKYLNIGPISKIFMVISYLKSLILKKQPTI